jgi:hypothetical protein
VTITERCALWGARVVFATALTTFLIMRFHP